MEESDLEFIAGFAEKFGKEVPSELEVSPTFGSLLPALIERFEPGPTRELIEHLFGRFASAYGLAETGDRWPVERVRAWLAILNGIADEGFSRNLLPELIERDGTQRSAREALEGMNEEYPAFARRPYPSFHGDVFAMICGAFEVFYEKQGPGAAELTQLMFRLVKARYWLPDDRAVWSVAAQHDTFRAFDRLTNGDFSTTILPFAIERVPAEYRQHTSNGDDPENTLVVETTKGRVVIAMRPDLAPTHVTRIKQLAREGFYDGVVFHRVIDGFMAQTGDPTGTGRGGSKYPHLKQEFSAELHSRGVVSMARAQDPNTANSQFFIILKDSGFLDRQYTVWGKVTEGMENVDKIKRGEPVKDPDKMVTVRVAADIPE